MSTSRKEGHLCMGNENRRSGSGSGSGSLIVRPTEGPGHVTHVQQTIATSIGGSGSTQRAPPPLSTSSLACSLLRPVRPSAPSVRVRRRPKTQTQQGFDDDDRDRERGENQENVSAGRGPPKQEMIIFESENLIWWVKIRSELFWSVFS